MKIKSAILLVSSLLVTNFICSTTYCQSIKRSSAYFANPSKVGVYVKTEVVNNRSGGGGGLLGAALSGSRSSKYDESLQYLGPLLNPITEIKELYKSIYTAKGKTVSIIDENLDSLDLKKFDGPRTGKKYYKKDVRFLKAQFNIDEILIVVVNYGVQVNRSHGFETSRLGTAAIHTQVVNLNDNSFIVREDTYRMKLPKRPWDQPPAYENLRQSILTSMQQAIIAERKKYQ